MPEFSFAHDNMLLVDGEYLRLDRSRAKRDAFAGYIALARKPIIIRLKDMYTKMVEQNPNADIAIGSIWLGRLAVRDSDSILSESGMYRKYQTQQNRGVYYEASDFITGAVIHDYWQAVTRNGLQTEAREANTGLHLLATLPDYKN